MKWGHRAVLLGAIFLFLMQSGCTMFIAKRAFKAIKAGVNEFVAEDGGTESGGHDRTSGSDTKS